MGKNAGHKIRKRSFCVGSFNARGLPEHHKKEEPVRDTGRYHVDVCCLQEIMIKDASRYGVLMAALL